MSLDTYLSGQGQARKQLKRINQLIESCLQNPFIGIGRPEALRENLAGSSSRRIGDSHRLVCRIDGPLLLILACWYHHGR
jgi:toxin YoeB